MDLYRLESEDVVEPQTYTQENIEFADAIVGEMNMGPQTKALAVDSDSGARLGDFLSRPVIIFRYDWLEGNVAINAANFFPWLNYFNDSFIRNKLANYGRLRCKLHLKFVINTSPFYYGRMRACYSPLDHDIAYNGIGDQWKFSQKPGVYLDPSESTTAEMVLPFFWYNNWLNATSTVDFQTMGRINLIQYAQLRSANGVSSAAASIVVYAWAEDVELAGLTVGTLQGKDEYESEGKVSGPASAVARVAGKLKNVPFIGGMATATEVGAGAVASVAKFFGFSNPPVISDVMPYQPKSFHAFSNVETSVPIDKLSMDPKNEITISPDVVGAPSEDEMSIAYIIRQPSFVQGALWTGVAAPNALLWAARVSPNHSIQTPAGTFPSGSYVTINYTPLSYVGECFRWWRGTVIYTIKFVKTKYHAGRLLITWDPGLVTSSDETVNYSRLVDIQQHDEIEVAIPYKATSLWTPSERNLAYSNGGGYPANVSSNGTLSIRVNSVLTGPAANPSIDILVYTKAGEDFRYAVPRELNNAFTPRWELQGADIISAAVSEDEAPGVELCTIGEAVLSLRSLLHRTTLVDVQTCGNPRTGVNTFHPAGAKALTNFYHWVPRAHGYDPNGRDQSPNKKNAGSSRSNIQRNNYLVWLSHMYAGMRGSTNHHFNVDPNGCTQPSITAYNTYTNVTYSAFPQNTVTDAVNATVPGQLSYASELWLANGGTGMTTTNTSTQSALSVNVPYYSLFKFRPVWNRALSDARGVTVVTVTRTGSGDTTWPILYHYVSAGVDFSLNYFVGTPTVWVYSADSTNSF